MRRSALIMCALLVSAWLYGQQNTSQQVSYSILFDFDSDQVDLDFENNRKQMRDLLDYMDAVAQDTAKIVSRIVIDSKASPEGGCTYNKKLAERRSQNLYEYVAARTNYDPALYVVKGTGIDWPLLIELVEQSNMEYKQEVLDILRYTPEETWRKEPGATWKTLVDSRNKQLMDLRGGAPYRYMEKHFFGKLRNGSALSIYFEQDPAQTDTVYVAEAADTVYQDRLKVETIHVPTFMEAIKSVKFALKTNLLSDLALIPNIELEIPIGDRFSANAEFARIWWNQGNEKCWQLQNYGIEARYWFGDREEYTPLTGFFGGIYCSRSTFDFEVGSKRGMQGDIDYSVGLSGGYSLPLSNIFNLEFSLAVGYINGSCTKYDVKSVDSNNQLELYKRGTTQNISTLFPTKAKVSLVWLINK